MRKKKIHVKQYDRKRHGRAKFGGKVRSHDKSGRAPKEYPKKLGNRLEKELLHWSKEAYDKELATDPREAGFILSSGEMPKLGKYGIRGEDHLVVSGLLPKEYKHQYNRGADVSTFQDITGALRTSFFGNGTNISFVVPPTKSQMDKLRKLFRAGLAKFPIYVDFNSVTSPSPIKSGTFHSLSDFQKFIDQCKELNV